MWRFSIALATVVATLPGAAQATSTTCSTSTVCAEYVNSYSGGSGGVAIHGEADSGIGVRGTSVRNVGFYGASGSGSLMMPGVEGESTDNTSYDTGGAFGLAFLVTGTAPAYGAFGYGNKVGLYGETENPGTSSQGFGLEGFDDGGTPAADFNAGVLGHTSSGVGVLAEANGTPTAGLVGNGYVIGSYSVANAASNHAVGIESESNGYPLEVRNTSSTPSLVQLAAPGYLINAYTTKGVKFDVDTSGNAYVSGTLETSKGTYVRTVGRSGAARIAYGARTTSPSIEDVGGGQLAGGRAVVSIDAAFADTVDPHQPYRIFLTPQGECNGLYVAQKNAGSFVVRELHAGRSSIAFDYRIVAKPADDDGARLAAAPAIAPEQRSLAPSPQRLPAPLSPMERLRARLGPQGYERAVATLRQRLIER